jgi:hypothetical protein
MFAFLVFLLVIAALVVLFFVGLWSAEQAYPGTVKKFLKFAEQRRDYHNKRLKDALDNLIKD